ncbi:MAG: lipid-A-disaccharide kinase [Polaromonas sp.]|nr:lipid-A-disaccharide kinase [Polaromonas sp.]
MSLLYGAAVWLRRQLYRHGVLAIERVGVPVLVVGNVVAGGAGKTPLVMALVLHFQAAGIRVGVVSRGYGRLGRDCREVLPETPVAESGDEAALIRRTTGVPVFIAAKRTLASRALLAAYPMTQLIVSDDGLQHYALGRDVEVAVFDDRGVGNGWLLPAGPLRERWPQRLHQGIDLVLHTGTSPAFAGYVASRRLADHAVDADGRTVALSSLQDQALVGLAAIAHPQAFFDMLDRRGLKLLQAIGLPDHDDFGNLPALPAGATVVCTEKDAVKLFHRPLPAATRVLAVPLLFTPEPAFFEAIDALLKPLLSPLPSAHGH